MKSNMIMAAALARIVAAAPQQINVNAILNAPALATVGPPTTAAVSSSTYSLDTASLAASISAQVTTIATASITGASASAASTQDPSTTAVQQRDMEERGLIGGILSAVLGLQASTSTTSTTTLQKSSTSTTSSTTACPTVPEAGTYCGFINPEDACAPQPTGYGPSVVPDTVDNFYKYPLFKSLALNAPTPRGYQSVFKNLNASTTANSYITYKVLTAYNTSDCAAFCDSYSLCTAFNIFAERDPSINPTLNGDKYDAGWGTNCTNPASITNYKCSLWGSNIDATSATNTGETREQFQVVITASNGYDKTNSTTPPTQPGWNAPTQCSGGAISSGGSYFMGSQFFPGPYNPQTCATYAQAQTALNKQTAQSAGLKTFTPCNMFNSYMAHEDGIPQGTYCQLFNTPLSTRWASFLGGWTGSHYFSVKSSYTYTLTTQNSGRC